MQSWIRRLTGIAAACVSTLCTIPLCAAAPAAGSDGVQAADLLALNDAPDYMSYLAAHAGASRPSGRIVLTSAQVSGEEGSRRVTGYLDARQEAVLTEEGGYVEYTFDVEEAGFYTITAKFCVPEGRHTAAERDILVNGELPYAEAAAVTFKRRWVNSGSIRQDTRGNDIRPIQEEEEGWQCRTLTDPLGYHAAPLTFYFEQGRNTLRFDAVREPLILEALILEAPQELPSYAELAATYESKGYADGTQTPITLQGEDADIKSDQTLAPASDRSSPATVPSSPSKIRLNTIGGESFAQTGQFITWKFEVTQAGLYTFAFKWRQNIQRGLTSVRRVILDNEVPCAELNQVEFPYGGGWNLDTLGDGTSDYRFFLDEGWHEITLEVTLGDMGKVVRLAQHSMEELNRIYCSAYYDMPLTNSQFQFETDSVPFLPIVFKGSLDYFTPYVNEGLFSQTDVLKMVEYGAYPAYVLTGKQNFDISDTASNQLFSTYIEEWQGNIVDTYGKIDKALRQVAGSTIEDREVLREGVVRVTYANGVEIYVNYLGTDYTDGGIKVPAQDYLVRG